MYVPSFVHVLGSEQRERERERERVNNCVSEGEREVRTKKEGLKDD